MMKSTINAIETPVYAFITLVHISLKMIFYIDLRLKKPAILDDSIVFQSLIEEGFSVEWMKDSECLRINKKEKNCVYLYDPFGGKSFNHIRNLGCR